MTDKPVPFPRGTGLPTQSPMHWVQQKDRYLRQLLIRDIEKLTRRRLVVYISNPYQPTAMIDHGDIALMNELLSDVCDDPVDLLLETPGGVTDATESIASLLKNRVSDLRVVVGDAAKSNGTTICLAGSEIVMGPTSELGPIDPQIGNVPCSILVKPEIAAANFPLHQSAINAMKQTKKLARNLLKAGMLSDADDATIDSVVNSLATQDVFHSHGSTIDHSEAAALGLKVKYLPNDSELWQKIWLLCSMYSFDLNKGHHLKIFEGRSISTMIASNGA